MAHETMTSGLKHLQDLLYRAIASADAVPGRDIAILSREIRGDDRLPVLARMQIYADAYFGRLLDCMREDYPCIVATVGEEAFENLVRSYLTRYPPTEPSLLYAGCHLADLLAGHELLERWPFIADLARLERLLIEVFHAPGAPTLSADEMRSIAPADWPTVEVRTHPALRMLDCKWRVNDMLDAIKTGSQLHEPMRGHVTLLVWRQTAQVYYRELDAPEHAALEVASGGASFAAVCEAFVSQLEAADPAEAINRKLGRWLADGLLVRAIEL
jgi:hypothetical protein